VHRLQPIAIFVCLVLATVACAPEDTAATSSTADSAESTAGTTTSIAATTSAPAIPTPSQAAGLIAQGPLGVGLHELEAVDASRGDRVVSFAVRYPAVNDSSSAKRDIPADLSGAPYPVVLTHPEMATLNGNHYASHGFVVVAVEHPANDGWAGTWMLDNVFDRLLALDALEAVDTEPLAGVADTTRAGVIDYSGDTLVTMALAGARVDPGFYLEACANAGDEPPFDPSLIESTYGWDRLMANNCMTEDEWGEFEAHATDLGIATEDGLWGATTDPRIKAVFPGGPEGAWLFGERGLAAASVPALLWAGSEDNINVYSFETSFFFDHLGSPTELITLIGADHIEPVYRTDAIDYLRLFSTAFFDWHLHESAASANLITEDFVEYGLPGLNLDIELLSFDGLRWGYVEE
jgi:predicted dienelactone hydrolase